MSQAKQIISELKAQIAEAVKDMNLSHSTLEEAEAIAVEIANKIRNNQWAVLGSADMKTQELFGEAISLSFVYDKNTHIHRARELELAKRVVDAHFSLLLDENGEIDENSLDNAVEKLGDILDNEYTAE